MDNYQKELTETLNRLRVSLPVSMKLAGMEELIAIGNLLVSLADVVKGEVSERQLAWNWNEIHRAKERDDLQSKNR